MKKFLNLVFLFACLSLCIATSADAQPTPAPQRVVNNTDCEMFVNVQYGLGCDAAVINTVSLFVGAGQFEIVNVGPGENIFNAKGYYAVGGSASKCKFHVSIDCGGSGLIDNVICGPPCGGYTAELIPGYGVVLSN